MKMAETVADATSAPEILTFGPPAEWETLLSWAKAHRIVEPVMRLVDVTLAGAASPTFRKNVAGSVLAVIARPTSRYIFEHWSRHSTYAEDLHRISKAIDADSSILDAYRPCGYERPAIYYLKKRLDPLYLAGVCVARSPLPTVEINQTHILWHDTLVAWLLLRAHHANKEGFRLEAHLHRVSARLRIAVDDEKPAAILLLGALACPVEGCGLLPQFEQTLAIRAESLRRTRQLDADMDGLLRSIIEIARHRPAELNLQRGPFEFPLVLANKVADAGIVEAAPQEEPKPLADDPESELAQAGVLSGETPATSGIQIPATAPTLAYQRLTGKSVLLASSEELQFLPWSWGCPTPVEREWLWQSAAKCLAADSLSEQFLGVVIMLALVTARSLRFALELGITASVEAEWTWLPDQSCLIRKTRRRYSGWEPTTVDELAWIHSPTDTERLPLASHIQQTLSSAYSLAPNAQCMGDLWVAVCSESPETAFNRLARNDGMRLMPAMLGRFLGPALQAETRDATFCKLLTSHPKSALPGACAYAGWSSQRIHEAISAVGIVLNDDLPNLPTDDSALGSLLLVLEYLLPDAFERAAARVKSRRQVLLDNAGSPSVADLVAFHNAFVAYIVVQLLAATGARPITDPFESPQDFNNNRRFVYVDDKSAQDLPGGRLIPLPANLLEFIETRYRDHLGALAQCLAANHPILAKQVFALLAGESDHQLPYFFMLKSGRAGLAWESVNETSIADTQVFDWPLPLNFLRHRLANQLRSLGVDVEIIDGLLGHGESGAESYGDESWRTWIADANALAKPIASAFDALGAPWLDGLPADTPPLGGHEAPASEALGERRFGRAARAARRAAWLKDAKADAIFHRKQLLAGRNIADLSADELDDIARKLLLNPKGMPHARGWFKYNRFLDALERYGEITQRRCQPKNHYVSPTSANAFTELAPRSAADFESLAAELAVALSEVRAHSYQQSAFYAALLLCFESHIADLDRLMAVMRSEDYRVVRFQCKYYVEFGADIPQSDPTVVTRRHRISARAAALLAHASGRTAAARTKAASIPQGLIVFVEKLSVVVGQPLNDCRQVLRAVVKLTDQWNAMMLPGVVGGYLAGRNESWSLPIRTWSQLVSGTVLAFPDTEVKNPEEVGEDIRIDQLKPGSDDAHVAAGDKFFRAFRKGIHDYASGTAKESDINDDEENSDRTSRRNLRRSLLRLIDAHSGIVSPTLLLLAKWIATHVTRVKKGRHVAVSSLFRYLTAMSGPFANFAFATDIRVMQPEDLTELYRQVLSSGRQRRARYRYDRLRAFQRWCEVNHGVMRPDWSELPVYNVALPANAGIISELEYLEALSALFGDPESRSRVAMAPAMLLLVCYRFGLRPREAIGMHRNEWLELGQQVMVIVQTSNLARTKTPTSSRRVVPLVFELTSLEREVIAAWTGKAVAISGDDRNAAFFCDDAGELLDLDRLSASVRDMLKAVTGNPDAILYHARHTAGTAVAVALADIEIPGIERLPGVAAPERRKAIQELLLGYAGVSRRSPWAVARYLGHSGTERARASYLHFFGDWVDVLLWKDAQSDRDVRVDNGILDLDALSALERSPLPAQSLRGDVRFAATPVATLQFMRLLGRQCPVNRAAESLSIPTHVAEDWANVVDAVDRSLYLFKQEVPDPNALSCRFLSHITEDGWKRLLKRAEEMNISALWETGIALDRLRDIGLSMIGPTRQWTPWTVNQIKLLRALLAAWSIPEKQQLLVGPVEAIEGTAFGKAAVDLGFAIYPVQFGEKKKSFQIDAGMRANVNARELSNFALRCGFIIRESPTEAIRNSFDLLVAGISLLLLSS